MEREDVRKILAILAISYPNSYSKLSGDNLKTLIELWYKGLKDFDTRIVNETVQDMIFNNTSDFSFNLGHLRAAIVQKCSDQSLNPEDDWQLVKSCMLKFGWDKGDKDIYTTYLPEYIRRIVSFDEVYNMAKCRPEDNEQFQKPRFVKNWKEFKAENDLAMLRGEQNKMLPFTQNQLAQIETKPKPLKLIPVDWHTDTENTTKEN